MISSIEYGLIILLVALVVLAILEAWYFDKVHTVKMIISVLCINALLLHTTSATDVNVNTPTYESTSDVIKVPAHIDVNSDEFECIYTDAENDIAYYRFLGDRKLASIGDTLTTCYGDTVTISYVDVYGFRVSDPESYIQPGMSGTSVLDEEGEIVGTVSTLLEDNEVYCIWN